MSTIRGQTFYGGNNEVVAKDLEMWGYWIFPDSVPGETPMRELASTKSEYEVDDYYFRKGTAFVERNIRDMPRLWLGKMIRAFVPIPWKFSLGSWAVCVFRWLIYIGVLLGLCIGWRGVPRAYNTFLLSTVAVTVVTVLGFWGCGRFAFAMEPFLLPIAGAGVAGGPGVIKKIASRRAAPQETGRARCIRPAEGEFNHPRSRARGPEYTEVRWEEGLGLRGS